MLYKSFSAPLADLDAKEGLVSAYWSAFGNEDAHGDVIERGAYAKTIREWGPAGAARTKVLWQHDWTEPIGRPLELLEDERGLLARFKLAPTTRGRDALILYDEGVITEHSVGIDVIRRREDDRRRIPEVRLWEGSPVTWGANAETPTLSVKALADDPAGALGRLAAQAGRLRKAARREVTDETAHLLEGWLAAAEGELLTLQAALAAAPGGHAEPPAPDGAPGASTASAITAILTHLRG